MNLYEMSQPARAVWIEIIVMQEPALLTSSHSLRGLCGLKYMAFV